VPRRKEQEKVNEKNLRGGEKETREKEKEGSVFWAYLG